MLLQDPKYTLNVTYMYGSALVEKDLDRCCASLASAIFIMSNKFSSSADEVCAHTMESSNHRQWKFVSFSRLRLLVVGGLQVHPATIQY